MPALMWAVLSLSHFFDNPSFLFISFVLDVPPVYPHHLPHPTVLHIGLMQFSFHSIYSMGLSMLAATVLFTVHKAK